MPIIVNEQRTDPAGIIVAGTFRTRQDARRLAALIRETAPDEPLVLDLTDLDVAGRLSWWRLRRLVNNARTRRPIAAHARTLDRRVAIERHGLRGAYPVDPNNQP